MKWVPMKVPGVPRRPALNPTAAGWLTGQPGYQWLVWPLVLVAVVLVWFAPRASDNGNRADAAQAAL